MTGAIDEVVVLAYALGLLAIGVAVARRRSSASDFFLADRNLGPLAVFATAFTTFLGTGLLFTLAAFGFRFGVGAFFLVGAAATGLVLLAWAAPAINRRSVRADAITLPGMFGQHWQARTRAVAAVVTAGLFTATLAANLHVVGTVLEAVTGRSPTLWIAGLGLVMIAYTALGGFRGVVWTDVAQLLVVVVMLLLILPASVLLALEPTALTELPSGHLDPTTLPLPILGAYLLIGLFAFFGSQDLFQRIFAARDPTAARRGMLLFTGLLVVAGAVAVGLGIAARVVVPGASPDAVVLPLTSATVPTPWVGVAVVGLLALANSDADSQVLTVASNVTEDLEPVLVDEPGPWWDRYGQRVAVVGIGAGALAVALIAPNLASLLGAVGSWFAILGLVVLATLYWDRMTDTAAIAGLVVGFTVPLAVVGLTGNAQAATVGGLVTGAVAVGLGAWRGEPALGDRTGQEEADPMQ